MRFVHITLATTLLCLLYLSGASCQQDYAEYEDDVAPAPPPPKPVAAPRGLSALQRSARGPVIGRPQPKLQQTKTTTTTEAAAPEVYDDEAVDEEISGEEQPATTTTEAPKKGLRGGVVRPFRSNTDLIEALKRRRQQVSSQHGSVVSSTTTTHSPVTEKQYKNNGRRNNKVADQAGSDTTRKSSTANASAGGRSRFSPRTKVNQEPVNNEPESSSEEPHTTRSRLFGRARKL